MQCVRTYTGALFDVDPNQVRERMRCRNTAREAASKTAVYKQGLCKAGNGKEQKGKLRRQ